MKSRVVRRQRRPVPGVGLLEHVHHQRRVGDAHRVRAEVRHGAERRQRVRRHPPEARLQPDVAAERGRDAHRSGTVGADAERAAARRRRPPPCRRTSRRASSCGSHGLRVIPVSAELVSPLQPNSGRRRLADQHGAGLAQARRRRRVDVPRLVRVDGAAAPPRRPAPGEHEVLDRRRHAVERPDRLAALPAPLARRRRGERLVGGDEAEGVDRRVRRASMRSSTAAGRLDRRRLAGRYRSSSSMAVHCVRSGTDRSLRPRPVRERVR